MKELRRGLSGFSSMVLVMILLALLCVPLIGATIAAAAAPTVGNTTTTNASVAPNQRKALYAQGRHWVMWSDGTDLVYSTSTDGAVWEAQQTLKAGVVSAAQSSWALDGTDVHLVSSATYRKGGLNADGSITWAAAEQDLSATCNISKSEIAVDTNHLPYIIGVKATENKPYIMRSSTTDGTWTFDAGAPWSGGAIKLTDTADAYTTCIAIKLTGGNVYFLHGTDGGVMYGNLWNGSTVGAEDTVSDQTTFTYAYASATSIGDTIYFAYWKSGIWVDVYTAGAWGVDVKILATTTATTAPALAADSANDVVYCFWLGNTVANKVSYLKCIGGAWDSTPTVWIDETTDTTPDRTSLSTSRYASSGNIGVVYRTLAASPYDVNYAFLGAPTVTTSAASSVAMDKDGATSGNFNADLTSLGNAASVDTWIEYGPTTAYGSNTATVARTGTGAYTVAIPAGLTPGATYHWNAVADGRAEGSDQTLVFTMPTVTTQATTSFVVTKDNVASFTLKGNITDLGVATDTYARFQWGQSDVGWSNTTADQTKSGTGAYTQAVTGQTLVPSKTYQARSVVENHPTTATNAGVTWDYELPALDTAAATNTNSSTATLNASVTDMGSLSGFYLSFKWGYTPATMTNTTAEVTVSGTGTAGINISGHDKTKTIYFVAHYRVGAYSTDLPSVLNFKPVTVAEETHMGAVLTATPIVLFVAFIIAAIVFGVMAVRNRNWRDGAIAMILVTVALCLFPLFLDAIDAVRQVVG